ncbi:MAG TPA: adenylate/guanylate cyclase domain-containing protein [Rhodocyclaceae bacterium]
MSTAAAAALLAVLALANDWLYALDGRAGDWLLRQHAAQRPPPTDIVVVDIDQKSLDDPRMLEIAGNWPWPRAVHGELLAALAAGHPKAVVFDLIFSEPDVFRPESDAFFSEMLRQNPAYLPLVIAGDGTGSRLADLPPQMGIRATPQADLDASLPLIAPKALDVDVWRTGIINFLEDADGIGRRYWLFRPQRGWETPSIAARVAADAGWALPAAAAIRLNWYARPFTRISYADYYLESLRESPSGLADVSGKIVIVGAGAPGLHDLRPTPLGATTPGPDILATAIANLADGDALRPLAPAAGIALTLALIATTTLAFLRHLSPAMTAAALAAASAVTVGSAWLMLQSGIEWRPYSAIAGVWLAFVGIAIVAHLQERQSREHAVQMFGRFLDPRVVHTLTNEGEIAAAQAGRSQEITVLFSDIRGFTTLSETRSPEEIVRILNRYFDLQVEAIFASDGTLDKFIGDAIMAFWGAPLPRAEHAALAVEAALAMADKLIEFKAELGELGENFDIGIGVHSGPAVVGFLGSSQRLDYTAIGDTVNLASRIEGQTKGIARVLVSDATRIACEACSQTFEFIDHGEFTVKGRAQAVRLFEPRRKP